MKGKLLSTRNTLGSRRVFLRCCLLVGLSGVLCSVTSCVSPATGIKSGAATEQEDIPVPASFEFDSAASVALDAETAIPQARYRSLRLYYRGEGDPGLLMPWYVSEMPKKGWKLRQIDQKQQRLYFEKGTESAEVYISRELDTKAAKYLQIVKVSVRPLGPDDFGVDQNIGRIQEAGIAPASLSTDETKVAPTGSTQEPAAVKGTPEVSTPADRNVPQAKTPASPGSESQSPKELKEIDELEENYR